MRAFIAVELPEEFAWELAGLARQLERRVEGRFLPQESYHLTLAFLGEIGEAAAASAIAALDAASANAGRITLEPQGLSTFGRKDKTLHLALRKDAQLMGLAERLRSELAARGLAFDEKPFVPHITIARHAVLPREPLGDLAFPLPCAAEAATLFKSTLAQDGATYKSLYTVDM